MAEFRKILHIHIDRDITDYIQAKQNDTNSRFLDCQLFQSNGTPYDLTRHKIRFAVLKPDGKLIFNNGKLTRASEGMFAIELNTQTISVVGTIVVEIKIYTEDEKVILTTKTFEIEVLEEIWSKESVESSNEYGAVVQLFQDVWEVRQSVFGMEKSIGNPTDDLSSGESSVSNTVFGGLNKLRNYLFDLIVPTVNNARDDVNKNTNDKIDKLSERINIIAPIYTTVKFPEVRHDVSRPSGLHEIVTIELPIYTGVGIINSIGTRIVHNGLWDYSAQIITESSIFTVAEANQMGGYMYFNKFVKLRVAYSRQSVSAVQWRLSVFISSTLTIAK